MEMNDDGDIVRNIKCWMKDSEKAHLPYSHWQELPPEPNFTHNNF
jgi:hypothetical protein